MISSTDSARLSAEDAARLNGKQCEDVPYVEVTCDPPYSGVPHPYHPDVEPEKVVLQVYPSRRVPPEPSIFELSFPTSWNMARDMPASHWEDLRRTLEEHEVYPRLLHFQRHALRGMFRVLVYWTTNAPGARELYADWWWLLVAALDGWAVHPNFFTENFVNEMFNKFIGSCGVDHDIPELADLNTGASTIQAGASSTSRAV